MTVWNLIFPQCDILLQLLLFSWHWVTSLLMRIEATAWADLKRKLSSFKNISTSQRSLIPRNHQSWSIAYLFNSGEHLDISEVNRRAIYCTCSAGQNISQYIGCTRKAQIRQKVFLGFSTYFSSRSWILLFSQEFWNQNVEPNSSSHLLYNTHLDSKLPYKHLYCHMLEHTHISRRLCFRRDHIYEVLNAGPVWDKNCVCACISIAV